MRGFIDRHLEPADRLGETLFGLIMALGFTGAVRWAQEDADAQALFVGILGCNIAWGIVDGVMYALGELFERGRRARLWRQVHDARDEQEARAHVAHALDARLAAFASPPDLEKAHAWALARIRSEPPTPARLTRADLKGGLAVALVVILATLPVVLPFLFVKDASLAVWVSHAVAIVELAVLGAWWARLVGASVWRIALLLTLIGLALAAVTVLLGG
jgi:VIT1/CCC1 family predicted Fe2+/Mn2+ transporter